MAKWIPACAGMTQFFRFDVFTKSRDYPESRARRREPSVVCLKTLDSRLRGNDDYLLPRNHHIVDEHIGTFVIEGLLVVESADRQGVRAPRQHAQINGEL